MRLAPTAGVAARDQRGRLLLVERVDDGSWCLPGGRLEPGETWRQCAEREFLEETGLVVAIGALLGVYSDPNSQVHRYGDGTEVQFVGVVFSGRVDGHSTRRPDDEINAVRYFEPADLPANVFVPDRPVIADALNVELSPFIR
jgi:8-oxo-dGTP pyrophosphatase MutT (NUDIX family)